MQKLHASGVAYGALKAFLSQNLPATLDDRDGLAYHLVPKALNEILGPQGSGWHTFKNEQGTTYVKAGRKPETP